MTIPDYQSIMLPLLKFISDQKEYPLGEVIDSLSDKFSLSEEERKRLLPSGFQAVFNNRVGWARTYLKKAGLIESTRRGYFRITDRGIQALKSNLERIDVHFLDQFDEFRQFRTTKRIRTKDESESTEGTPEESLESAYLQLRDGLVNELIHQLRLCSPNQFERIVVDLVVKMGYGGSLYDAGRAIGRTGDEGIDGIIKEDRLGLDTIYIQAKRWGNSVGRPEVQRFAGALQGHRAKKGILITTSSFTKDAYDYSTKIDNKIILIDGEFLAQLMIDYSLGVTTTSTYEIKKIDSDYFTEE